MKKIIFFLTLLLFVANSFSQTPSDPSFSKDYYLKKSKNQKTTGWVLLIGGGVVGVIGFTKAKQILNDPNIGFTEGFESGLGWTLIGLTGSGLALCSIPLFLSSRKNARKAATISFNNQKILFPQQNTFILKPLLTFTLKVELRQ